VKITWTKDQLRDTRGYPLTQSLFLEINYSEYAVFTFNDEPKEYNGKIYPSLRQYYLDIADPTEYQFAKQCLLGWDHWQRICENVLVKKEVDKWREELEVALRSEGILSIIETGADGQNFQAAKWLADKGWEKNKVGRPSKAESEREKRIANRINNEFGADIIRMEKYKGE
jgi:hypothetical protein